MDTEFADRQQAIKLRLAGQPIADICQLLGHPVTWFHLWWRRYRALGPNGLFDLTRTNVQPRRIAPDLERTIITIRQRLASQAHPGTRYSLMGPAPFWPNYTPCTFGHCPACGPSNGCSNAMASAFPKCGWPPSLPTQLTRRHPPTSPISSIKLTASARST